MQLLCDCTLGWCKSLRDWTGAGNIILQKVENHGPLTNLVQNQTPLSVVGTRIIISVFAGSWCIPLFLFQYGILINVDHPSYFENLEIFILWYFYSWKWKSSLHISMAHIRKDDNFTLNCRPTGTMGCEEQVADVKCTRPLFPFLVKGLAPRLPS